jgi:DNA-binding protein H-NS
MAKIADLDKLTVPELTQLIQDATQALKGKKDQAKVALVEEMRAKAAQLGLDLGDLLNRSEPRTNVGRVRNDAGKGVPVRYRGPDGQTWSGRGRMPLWLRDAIVHGQSKEAFAV